MFKKISIVIVLFSFFNLNAQITFRACEANVLGAQDYIFTQNGTTNDASTIRNTFETLAADFTQSCPAGVCELRIIWNITMTRWEIQLDNDGPVSIPDYTTGVLYYNTTASVPNPPSLALGTWVDNQGGACGGNDSFTTLTGNVQDVTLGINDLALLNQNISIYPNPISSEFKIESSVYDIEEVVIYSLLGKNVKSITTNFNKISVTDLSSNVYLVKIITTNGIVLNKKIVVN